MEARAEVIARSHQAAEGRLEFEGHTGMAAIVDNNAQCFTNFGAPVLDATRVERLNAATRQAPKDLGALLETRREAGCVRHCHGDLHLRNIGFIDGRPIPFRRHQVQPIDSPYRH